MGLIEELQLRPIINASGNLTVIGGTTLSKEVIEAMAEASSVFLDMNELHIKAGQYIAKLIGVEDTYITSGAGAGIVLAVAACIIRDRTDRIATFPHVEDLRHEVIVQKKHRNFYDYMIEITGAKIVEIGDEMETTEDDLRNAINDKTCAVMYFAFDPLEGILPLDKVVKIAHSHNLPVIVDAAPELPPKTNLKKFYDVGADLVIFAGGKDIGAPNDTGIILGKKELIHLCRRLGPHSYEKLGNKTRITLGRPMKTSKEDIFAVVAAIKKYLTLNEEERLRRWEEMVECIISELKNKNIKNINKFYPKGFGHPRPACVPRVEITPLENLSIEELLIKLREGEPPIYAYEYDGKLYINPQCLRDGEEKILIRRLIEILNLPS